VKMNPGWTVLLDLAARGAQSAPQRSTTPPQQRAPPSPRLPQRSPPQHAEEQKRPGNGGRSAQVLSDDHDEGIWPDDSGKSYYDADDGCNLASAPHNKKIRSSWSEGLFDTPDSCCEHIYCFADRCDAYDDSTCTKKSYRCSPRYCEGIDPSPSPASSACKTIPDRLICGQDCDKYPCYDQETCSKLDGVGETDKVYVTDRRTCCVDYTNLNGYSRSGDDAVHRMCEHVLRHRVTDYKKQEPSGQGGYRDRGEFSKRR